MARTEAELKASRIGLMQTRQKVWDLTEEWNKATTRVAKRRLTLHIKRWKLVAYREQAATGRLMGVALTKLVS